MKFSFPFFSKNKKESDENIFGLLLKEQEGIGIVFKKIGSSIKLQSYEKFNYSNSWENLVQDIDDVLFKIEQSTQLHFSKTIIFVFSHLLDSQTQQIKKPYLIKIKEVLKNLELEALGFIECYEAISLFCQKQEEMPLSSILIELDKTQMCIYIYKSGKVAFQTVISRTDNLVDDFIKAVDPIKKTILLPARIILYDSKDLSNESTVFITHNWESEYFVQMPRIKIVHESELIEGLTHIFEDQIKSSQVVHEASTSKKIEKSDQVLGFAINQDILTEESYDQNEEFEDNVVEEQKTNLKNQNSDSNFKNVKKRIFDFFLPILTFFPKFSFKINPIIPIIVGIIIILFTLGITEYFFHKAELKIYLPSQKILESVDIEAEIDNATSELPITISTVSATLSELKPVTGKREIGDKAKGEVMIHSFEDREKSFSKGLVIKTGELQFTLDEEIKVASSSLASDGSAKLPGKKSAKVTALSIGQEFNLDKGKRFSIGDFAPSIYFAINESRFSGGTKREVRTVSKTDIDELNTKLLSKAKNTKELIRQSSQNEQIISELTSIELQRQTPSKEIGEEASEVTLTSKAIATYYLYDYEKMLKYIMIQITPKILKGYRIQKDNISIKITSAIFSKKNILDIEVAVKGTAMKNVTKKNILQLLKGKQKKDLNLFVKNELKGEAMDVKISSPLPFITFFMPLFEKNIDLTFGSL